MKYHSSRAGFSLSELLVVILITLLLFALGSGVIGESRKRMKSIQCTQNLSQIGVLVAMYGSDHQFFLPPYQVIGPSGSSFRQLWFHHLLPYVREGDWRASGTLWTDVDPPGADIALFRCPAQKDPFLLNYRLRYGINPSHAPSHNLDPEANSLRLKLSQLKNPSHAIMIADSMDSSSDGIPFSSTPDVARGFLVLNQMSAPISDRHRGGSNVLFADGHVAWYRFYELIAHPGDSAAVRAEKASRWDQRQ